MTETTEAIKIHRGLKGVYFDRSPCTFIDGKAGDLRYRGYSIHDLAEHSSFEETAWLLLNGELPNARQLSAFDDDLKAARSLPEPIYDIIRVMKSAHPMDVLRTAASALSAFDPEVADISREATLRKGIRLTSQVAMIIAAHSRIREGLEPVAADRGLAHAANLLWMLTGTKPSGDAAQLIDRDLILHAEHGSNASSFTARVVVGTEANLHAAITAAIAALSGPAHGGAAEDVMKMAEEIGDAARAADYVRAKRKAGEPVTGFGHRVYRAEDPRARHMRAGVERLSKEMGSALVRNFAGGRTGDGALRAPRRQRERRFLFRRRLPPARHQTGSVRADLRDRPHAGLGRAGFRADREQHFDPSADALLRTRAAQLSANQHAGRRPKPHGLRNRVSPRHCGRYTILLTFETDSLAR